MSEKMTDIEIDFTDEEFLKIAVMAHEEDITINQLVRNALQFAMDKALTEEKENGTNND